MALRLSSLSAMYPNPAIAIRLLIVMLAIIAAQTGKIMKMSGGGKNSHKYPPTMTPMGRAPAAQARSLCFLSNKMRQAAMRLALGPRITSGAPMKKYALVRKHPSVTPPIIGQPNRIVNAIMKSEIRSCIGPYTVGLPIVSDCIMLMTTYNDANSAVNVMSLLSNFSLFPPTPG